jgi:predicted hydrocarbon binding protein
MDTYEKEVMVFNYGQKKRFFQVSLRLKNTPGALGNVATVLGIRGVNILDGYFGLRMGQEWGTMSFFAESTNSRIDAAWLKDFVASSVDVSSVEVKESVNGFIADSLNFPLVWNSGDRAVLMRSDYVRVMLDFIRKSDPGKGNEMAYRLGYEYGKASMQNLIQIFRPTTSADVANALQIYSAVGWGRPELLEYDSQSKHVRVRFSDGFECVGADSKKPAGYFTVGHMAGWLSPVMGADLQGEEKACAATGASHCDFVFTSSE